MALKFNNILNPASTMLDNVLTSSWFVAGVTQEYHDWGLFQLWEKVAICHNLPIFNPVILNSELFQYSAILLKVLGKSVGG